MTKLVSPIESNPRHPVKWLMTTAFPSTLGEVIQMREMRLRRAPRFSSSYEPSESAPATDSAESQGIIQVPSRTQRFLKPLKAQFIRAFGFDGYNQNTTVITCADGKETPYTGDSLPLWLIITSLLGLPNRPHYVEDGIPQYTVLQFFRNFVGGWNPIRVVRSARWVKNESDDTPELKVDKVAQWNEKKIWQVVAIPFKILILLIKLVEIPFKILLNTVKLVTEFLLPLVASFTAKLSFVMVAGVVSLSSWAWIKVYSHIDDESYTEELNWLAVLVLAIPLILYTALTVAMVIFQYATVLACRIGLALTSPAKSAQMAYALGRNLDIGVPFISKILGLTGALLSLTLSAVLWTITLPLALSALVTVIPSLLIAINWVAQIPFVASSLAWASQLPVVTTLVNGLFGTVGAALTVAFGPATSALAALISVQIPTVVMAVGATLGLLVTPVAAILSLGADKLSDFWATWMNSFQLGPIGYLKSRRSSKVEGEVEYIPLLTPETTPPTPTIYKSQVCVYREKLATNTLVVSDHVLKLGANNWHLQCAFTLANQDATRFYHAAANNQWSNEGVLCNYRLPTEAELRDATPLFQPPPPQRIGQ